MAIFAYTVHVDGLVRVGEVDAASIAAARRVARGRHQGAGTFVKVTAVICPPPRIGSPRDIPTMPTPYMRVNYQRAIYEPRIRKERGERPVHR